MFNAVILPILTSLAATGLGILAVWLYNRKRSDDKIARITNEIVAVKAQMENGFNRENLEKDALLNAFSSAKTEMEQANEAAALKQREFYQNIIERIHNESIAREEFSRTVKISIDTIQQSVANNSESIGKLEQEVSKSSNLISRIINIMERDINPLSCS